MVSKRVSVRGVARSAKAEERRTLKAALKGSTKTHDSYQNFALNLGIGTNNALSQSTYGFNPITRVRTELEWIHRGSWLGGVAIEVPADDMTREGVEIISDMDPDDKEKIEELAEETDVWNQLNAWVKWAGLYGGSILVPLIDGHDLSTPLDIKRVGKNSFRGLLVLDRWSVDPSLENLVTEPGPFLGKPKFYTVTSDAPGYRGQRIHYTRAWRNVGIELPYWQAVMENLWGISVFERLYDRMVAFDSATTGAAQLVYRAWIRTYKVKKLREAVAMGGDMLKGVVRSVEFMRQFQGIEGVTMIDVEDELEMAGSSNSFAGIGDALLQFAQQIAGALQIPLVRLLGQSPAGLNATGEGDLRTYYDGIAKRQKKQMKRPVLALYEIMARSLGIDVSGGLRIRFKPLWQLDEKAKAEVAKSKTESVLGAYEAGLIGRKTALQELRAQSQETGLFGSITDEMIEEADDEPPNPMEDMMGGGAGGFGGGAQAQGDRPEGDTNGQGEAGRGKVQDRARMVDVQGIPIFIENHLGSIREGTGKGGAKWRAVLMADYGYIEGTASAEGPREQMDVFVGPNAEAPIVYVIDQVDPDTRAFDEHKCMVGFDGISAAIRAYQGSYSDRRDRIGDITPMSMDAFKTWLKTGVVDKPVSILKAA